MPPPATDLRVALTKIAEEEDIVNYGHTLPKVAREALDADEAQWKTVGDGTPLGAWLETKRDGEAGTNVCMCRLMCLGDEPEWIEKEGGRTTVTHSTFAAPTHWRWP